MSVPAAQHACSTKAMYDEMLVLLRYCEIEDRESFMEAVNSDIWSLLDSIILYFHFIIGLKVSKYHSIINVIAKTLMDSNSIPILHSAASCGRLTIYYWQMRTNFENELIRVLLSPRMNHNQSFIRRKPNPKTQRNHLTPTQCSTVRCFFPITQQTHSESLCTTVARLASSQKRWRGWGDDISSLKYQFPTPLLLSSSSS